MGKELYDSINTKVGDLLREVELGKIGLPDLQRPFVWSDTKVRELLDSMLKGYPIGYIMLWSSPDDYVNVSQIGDSEKIYKRPDSLVIDGQQRLTALIAAMRGVSVKDRNYKTHTIRICFDPLHREFAVWTQAYDRNPEWITAVSEVFLADENHASSRFRKDYIKGLNDSRAKKGLEPLTDDEECTVEQNLNDLLNLGTYLLPTLKISGRADEEDVAEIFVRVNSGGTHLTEKNFIQTLLAVYDNDAHDKINEFCAKSRVPDNGTSFNQIIEVDPSHVIRVAVGVGLRRARLKYAYQLLRGKDLKTGEVSASMREEKLADFGRGLDRALNLNDWHAFLNLYAAAGYLKASIVASSNAVVYSYVLFLIGKYEYKVPVSTLNKVITKWIFMATITGWYTGSTESTVEKQFADLRSIGSADEFVAFLDESIAAVFTDDFFTVPLTHNLEGSSATSPAWFGYVASLIVLGRPILFGTAPVAQYFTVGASGTKPAVDKHHIFPKNYLAGIGIEDDRERNQIANFTFLDYATNISIGDKAPVEYVTEFKNRLGYDAYTLACEQHALPEEFESLDYQTFLSRRRKLMADTIRQAYEKLCE